ncbi:heparinase II/III domain-containing protein [Victivallis vadensis]|uniref:Heparinase II/III-like protein n=1 Tax=Victivallis vadensis TaxID=172901 RepID=A0A2U1AWL9_9BACT|nr:heparinase II/III family protein [Victivallis vadensis]PVY40637.1 heparinase II/III-like protein [Victivallis vadensis]
MSQIKQFALLLTVAGALGAIAGIKDGIPMERLSSSHPRLLVGREQFAALKQNAQAPAGQALAARIRHDAELILGYPPQPREMIGRRLLSASRNVLYRVNTLAVAFRLTGKREYADRAIREMLNAASYSDWNPSHFLDVGEMTLAVAVGYDWLYELLTPEQRSAIELAIIDKGLKPSFQGKQGWVRGTNNWNAVCHAGMVAGALAVADREPELARRTIERAVENLPRSMKASYFPNGAYPEGPMYWGYGTEFTTVLLALLDGAFGEDFGLSAQPGFDKTGDFILATTGPTGKPFNYADCVNSRGASFATVWLARKFDRPDWFDTEMKKLLAHASEARPRSVAKGGNRLLPLALLYLKVPEGESPAPLAYYSGKESLVPISVHRSDRTAKAAWVGLKAGAPAGPHGHMDGGSFVFETEGYRWAVDLGMENYTKIEATGLRLWDSTQGSDRWKVFRLSPESHNILRIDNRQQNVKGKSRIVKFSENSTEMDLTPLYTPVVKKATRTATLLPGRALEIRDRLTGLPPGAEVTWQMCTFAEPEIRPDGTLLLRHGRQELLMDKNSPGDWQVVPEAELRQPYDSPNPGARMIRFAVPAPADGKLEWAVTLTPLPRRTPAGHR